MFRGGKDVSASDFVASWQTLDRIRAEWNAATAGFDAVLCPTLLNLPPKLADIEALGDVFKAANLLTLRNTRVGNLMGLSVLTLPTGVPSCGISLMGKPFGEEALLRVGVAAEEALS